MTIIGIDISSAQGVIQWDQVKATGQVSFVFCKATEGLTFTDQQFATNWSAIKTHEWPRGAYHFARTSNDPVQEADHFVSTVMATNDLQSSDMLVLDIETSLLKGTDFTDWVLAWCNEVQTKTNHMPIIYTGGPFWMSCAPTSSDDVVAKLAVMPLWLAAYTTSPDKYVPAAWKNKGWTIWQRSGDVAPPGFSVLHLSGCHGNIDADVFNGSLEDFQTFAASLCTASQDQAPAAPDGTDGANWEMNQQ
jgi:lysozyme